MLILKIFSFYQGLNWGPSDLEPDDIPMCHRASLPLNLKICLLCLLQFFLVSIDQFFDV